MRTLFLLSIILITSTLTGLAQEPSTILIKKNTSSSPDSFFWNVSGYNKTDLEEESGKASERSEDKGSYIYYYTYFSSISVGIELHYQSPNLYIDSPEFLDKVDSLQYDKSLHMVMLVPSSSACFENGLCLDKVKFSDVIEVFGKPNDKNDYSKNEYINYPSQGLHFDFFDRKLSFLMIKRR